MASPKLAATAIDEKQVRKDKASVVPVAQKLISDENVADRIERGIQWMAEHGPTLA